MRQLLSWQMKLPLPSLLALRYLRSGRRDAYVSFLSLLATGGITLGVSALILVLSGLSGLQDFLRSDVLSRTPHLEVEVPEGADPQALCDAFMDIEGVVDAQRILRGRGWVLFSGGAVSVQVVGFEGQVPRSFPLLDSWDWPSAAVTAEEDRSGIDHALAPVRTELERGLFIGDSLARRWAVSVGEKIEIVSPRPTLTPFGPQPRIQVVPLIGVFRTGHTEDNEQRVAIPLATAQRLFGDRGSRIEIKTTDLDTALLVAEPVAKMLPAGGRVRNWQQLNRALFFALKLEKVLMFVAVFLIVPVAAMSLITVLALLISSKRGEIGMLQAMGASPSELRQAFLVLGGALGTVGLILGGTLGIGSAWVLDRFRLISPPGDIYFLDHIPFLVEGDDLVAIFLATGLLIASSTLFAARRAAALGPVEALRG